MQLEHRDALLSAAADGRLWELNVTNVLGPETADDYIARALAGRQDGTVIPFTTIVEGSVVGSTRFWKVDSHNRKAEIGHTWLAQSWQRSGVNTEAKYLMLQYAFETLKLIRVQFTTDELNTKSQAAILRLGAVQEGLIRNERIMPDGRKRNSFRYSIIDSEWPDVKARLAAKLLHAVYGG
ncbi:GNAT family N-acetyltransferase [Mesorhizobium mediterraneum]|uniref:GNAT family N-acetyltransferase n=1 Tax=Mesorhizobium mediterraneum TaxID=43617 RepID=UPI00178043C7|nr:GNAT family protein [Mesorhizobium mediterraneum]